MGEFLLKQLSWVKLQSDQLAASETSGQLQSSQQTIASLYILVQKHGVWLVSEGCADGLRLIRALAETLLQILKARHCSPEFAQEVTVARSGDSNNGLEEEK